MTYSGSEIGPRHEITSGPVAKIHASRSGSRIGSGLSTSTLAIVKINVFAPMASASVTTAARAYPGCLTKSRAPWDVLSNQAHHAISLRLGPDASRRATAGRAATSPIARFQSPRRARIGCAPFSEAKISARSPTTASRQPRVDQPFDDRASQTRRPHRLPSSASRPSVMRASASSDARSARSPAAVS